MNANNISQFTYFTSLSFVSNKKRENFKDMLENTFKVAFSSTLGLTLSMMVQVINLSFIGHIGTPE